MIPVAFRLSGRQHAQLQAHLFPGDGKEAVAIIIAGRRAGAEQHVLTARELMLIPHNECAERHSDFIRWPTSRLFERLPRVASNDLAVVKIHSHPGGYRDFSLRDDGSDFELFRSIFGWSDSLHPHASLIMLPGGEIFGRAIWPEQRCKRLRSIVVAGNDLKMWFSEAPHEELPESLVRNAQAFGGGTLSTLRRLRAGVVGCSGTGSPVIEQLARLGIGSLVLVDPETIEEKNLNRILNATADDAANRRTKVSVLKRAIDSIGFGTEVVTIADHLGQPEVVRQLASCDILFGCMDSVDGRQLLNRLAAFYSIPYFDVGVRLIADGRGGVSHICGSVHYLQPDGASLVSRGIISEDRIRAEALHRESPEHYANLRDEGYIAGVAEDRPAVLPVNMLFASLAINEFLARLHNYRHDDNQHFAQVTLSLEQAQFYFTEEGQPCPALAKHVGRGDVIPLLDRPALSER